MKRDYWPTAEWNTASPAQLRIDPVKLGRLDRVIDAQYSNITGIVVVRGGYIAFEKYRCGYSPRDAVHVASVTKSVLSALVGIAIASGDIAGPEQKVMDFFPDYAPRLVSVASGASGAHTSRNGIRLQHLLTMTAPYPYEDGQESLEALCTSPDWIGYTLDMLGKGGPIGAFKYSTAGAHLLSAIITRSTGQSAREFANEHLFAPLGMQIVPEYAMEAFGYEDLFGKKVRGWVSDPAGNSTGGWGLTLTPRDMARFGFLYLNRGTWGSRQVVPAAWVECSTVPHAGNYGCLWWLFREEGLSAYAAMGDGGNAICCLPEKDLVVAIASEIVPEPADRWNLIRHHIIPAVY